MSHQSNEKNDRTPETPGTPDSGVVIVDNDQGTMAQADERAENATVTVEIDGVTYKYTFKQIAEMGAALGRARAQGHFPPTTASGHNIQARIRDYFRFVQLTEARGQAPPEEWNMMPNVVQLLIEITQEIRARDKVAAEMSEQQRVNAHVANMMSGVGAEARLYNIVRHAVTYAINNGSGNEAATITGQNMATLLNGIRGVINEMAGQGIHGVHGVNVENVLEEVFRMIDFALNAAVDPIGENVQQMNGQINRVDGQIMHLNAIGQHVNAISGHVNSLDNNINAFGTLLNSTNGNVVSLTTQIGLLQTIINMLPRMIAEACEQMIPGAAQEAMTPLIAAIQARLGVPLPNGAAQGTQQQPRGLKKVFKSVKKLFRKK
ncbi:hypothetical protein Daesc_002942 [Daldinia eschscholtzii]|uniref:Uncharacterized protein n=1 Tax=Daldinia eschscholtzii TaxID=292717 RepID=A0AAX6MRQ5_9PEZI